MQAPLPPSRYRKQEQGPHQHIFWKVTSKEECRGETAQTVEPFTKRNFSEKVCSGLQLLPGAPPASASEDMAQWRANPVWELCVFLMQPSGRTIGKKHFVGCFFFPLRTTLFSTKTNCMIHFFVPSLGKEVLLTFLLAQREGRRKYTYIKKLKLKPTDLSVDHLIQFWVTAGSFCFIINI